MAISAARSWIFNQILSRRVECKNWNTIIDGDVLQMEGKGSFFNYCSTDETIDERLRAMDIHPSGALWGEGEPPTKHQALEIELDIARCNPELIAGLQNVGLNQSRRALRQIAYGLSWEWIDEYTLGVQFKLLRGQFATSVLREISSITN